MSAQGVIPLSPSLDHVGPIARNLADVTLLFRAIADGDGVPPEDFLQSWNAPPKLQVGVPSGFFYDDLDTEVEGAVKSALRAMNSIAADIRQITLPIDNDRTVQAAESYAFHAATVAKSPELYQPETLRRILTGEKISAEDYRKKRLELDAARREIRAIFDTVDVIVTPATPIPATTIAELQTHPEQLRPRELLLLRNTRPFNVWGLPAISLPCGFTRAGLPIGLQIAGAPGREDWLLHFAHACERSLALSHPIRTSSV
ncbi:MAG: hypothetical protein DMG81_12015 [Acidobacteria bacterium]|nr:MAG: hypothetical protein DMG81_12015 [Acidobacteriota bacterium]